MSGALAGLEAQVVIPFEDWGMSGRGISPLDRNATVSVLVTPKQRVSKSSERIIPSLAILARCLSLAIVVYYCTE
jgi:hypothetical protein